MKCYQYSQLTFARKEFLRGLEGVTEEEGKVRFDAMNCISWIVGHLTSQEQTYWVYVAQDKVVVPDLHKQVGSGEPASTPSLSEMWDAWHKVTAAADTYLQTLSVDNLSHHLSHDNQSLRESIGTMLARNIYHYWYHLGEALSIRQMLGHSDLPQFVGNMSGFEFFSENA
jgi:hypothetical protein